MNRAPVIDHESVAPSDGLRVLMLGPGLDVRGGVSRCEAIIVEQLAGRIALRHVATTVDGGPWRKLACFVRSLRETRREMMHPGNLIVYIHFASRGSTLRKMLLANMTLRAGRTLLLHAHGGGFDRFYTGMPEWLRSRIRRIFRQSPRFLVLSETWKRFYVDSCGVPGERIEIMRNPVELPATIPAREGRERVQFVYLGRISEAKGTFDLLGAFARLQTNTPTRLVIAGDGDVDRARRAAHAIGGVERCEVLHWIDAATRDRLLAESDVFVLPSHREGVPMSMLEAMASGLPAIGTLVGGVPEILAPGVNGLAVAPGDTIALAAAMRRLADDPVERLRLGKAARASVEPFDAVTYGERLLTIFQRLWRAPVPIEEGAA